MRLSAFVGASPISLGDGRTVRVENRVRRSANTSWQVRICEKPANIVRAQHNTPRVSEVQVRDNKPKRAAWFPILAATLGLLGSEVFGPLMGRRITLATPEPVRAESTLVEDDRMVIRAQRGEPIPIDQLGIRVEEYMGEKELRARKTTVYSEAEDEIMELDEYEVSTQWFRDLQRLWAALASVAGIFVLYRGGVLWERWIQEQERKDMEEEIKLTGTFISPRAVRKDEDEHDKKKKGKKGKGGDEDDKPPEIGDSPNIEGLNRLLK